MYVLLLTLAVLIGRKAPSASSSAAAADMPRGVSSIVSEDGGCGAHMLGTRSPVDWLTTGVEGRRTFGTAVLSVAALYTCGREEEEVEVVVDNMHIGTHEKGNVVHLQEDAAWKSCIYRYAQKEEEQHGVPAS